MKTNYVLTVLGHAIGVYLLIRIFYVAAPCCLLDLVNTGVFLFSVLLLSRYTFKLTKRKWLNERVYPYDKAVLITGCDSGFGNATAARLDEQGFHVFASCLFPDGPGAQKLKETCSNRLQILGLDVTNENSIQEAVKFVKENLGTSELWAVVNNAGIYKGFSVEFSKMQDFVDCMEVNLYGPIRVSKAFLPLLRQNKGRIINLISVVGRLEFPYLTPYTASKYAAAAFNDCLRQELDVWGVKVVSIEPEIFQTGLTDENIIQKHLDNTLAELDESIKQDYGKEFIEEFEKFRKFFTDFKCPKIELVVDDIEEAVSSEYPDIAYRPRRNLLFRILLHIYEISPLFVQDIVLRTFFYIFHKFKFML